MKSKTTDKSDTTASKQGGRWLILACCFFMIFITLGFCSGNKSLYLSAITEALGVKRSLFSVNDSCRYVATAVVNLFFGTLIHKYGERKLVAAGFLCLITSCLLYAFSENILLFYLGGCFLGMGLSWTTTTMVSYIIGKWFKEKTGTVMGFALAANGLGGAVAAQIISPLIYAEGNPFGYRNAYLLTAGLLTVAGILVVGFLKETPDGIEKTPYVKNGKRRGQSWAGLEFQQVVRRPYFIVAAVCVFLTGMCLQSVSGVAAAHMKDVGLAPEYVAYVLSFHALALALFKFLIGIVYDKIGLRGSMLICDVAAIVNTCILALLTNSAAGRTLAMVYGVFISLAMPLETIIVPFIATELFGEKSYAKALGILISINTAGYAIGTPIANLSFDCCGTYRPALLALSGIMIAVTVSFQFVLAKAQKVKALYAE